MALAYDSDKLTRDIDAAIIDGHGAVIRAVQEIARARGWPTTWLKEQATPYMPSAPDHHAQVVLDHPALRVLVASPLSHVGHEGTCGSLHRCRGCTALAAHHRVVHC